MKRSFAVVPMVLAAVAVSLTLSACGSGVTFVRTDPTKFPPKPDGATIEIFEGEVTTPHVVIGTLYAKKNMDVHFDDSSTYDELLKTLKRHARKVGADALIQVQPHTSESGGMKSRVEMSAVAIRYLRKEATVTSAASR